MFAGILKASMIESGRLGTPGKVTFDLPTEHGIALLSNSITNNLYSYYKVYLANKSGKTINRVILFVEQTKSFRTINSLTEEENTESVQVVTWSAANSLSNNNTKLFTFTDNLEVNEVSYLAVW